MSKTINEEEYIDLGQIFLVLWKYAVLILIVGIIFATIRIYEYRLTPYILMLEPDVKPTEAIKLSKERTKGWKGKMSAPNILPFQPFVRSLESLMASVGFTSGSCMRM